MASDFELQWSAEDLCHKDIFEYLPFEVEMIVKFDAKTYLYKITVIHIKPGELDQIVACYEDYIKSARYTNGLINIIKRKDECDKANAFLDKYAHR